MRVLCFGSLNLDHTYQVPHFVRPGETLSAGGYEIYEGGKGLNQAIALAKAGAKTWMAGCIGPEGGRLLHCLKDAGVNVSLVRETQIPTGHAIIQVRTGGQNCILIFHGANYAVTEQQIDETLACFGPGDVLLLQNEINGLDLIARKARERGMNIWFNPSPVTQDLADSEAIQLADGLVVNELELATLAGVKGSEEGIHLWQTRHPGQKLVLTLGENGSVFADGDLRIRQDAVSVRAVDTTGAGDTFLGFFLAEYLHSSAPETAMRQAAQAAAIAVTRPGAAQAIPDAREVASYFSNS